MIDKKGLFLFTLYLEQPCSAEQLWVCQSATTAGLAMQNWDDQEAVTGLQNDKGPFLQTRVHRVQLALKLQQQNAHRTACICVGWDRSHQWGTFPPSIPESTAMPYRMATKSQLYHGHSRLPASIQAILVSTECQESLIHG